MSSSAEFNVTAATALVLGGIAAAILAFAVVLGGYGHGAAAKGSVGSPPAASSAVGSRAAAKGSARGDNTMSETEVEYPLDTSGPTEQAR